MLEVRGLSKKFGAEWVVRELSLSLQKQRTLSILGKSGCGKTTFLKCVAGLVEADSGQIYLDGKELTHLKVAERNMVYLYQEDLLFPHLNAFENIAFGLRIRKESEGSVKAKTRQMLEDLGLAEHGSKMPHQLSGGQRQRVSFGRAIIVRPDLLLLDEPFSSLDAQTRQNTQQLFKQLVVQYGITSVLVTHDLREALLMGDQIGYMDQGQLDLYDSKSAFIDDARTGAHAELEFWTTIQNEKTKDESNQKGPGNEV